MEGTHYAVQEPVGAVQPLLLGHGSGAVCGGVPAGRRGLRGDALGERGARLLRSWRRHGRVRRRVHLQHRALTSSVWQGRTWHADVGFSA